MQSSSSTASRNTDTSSRWDIDLCEFAEKQSLHRRRVGFAGSARRAQSGDARVSAAGASAAARSPGGRGRSRARTSITFPEDPYAIEIEAVDSLLPGEVAVVGTQKSMRNAPWGELLVHGGAEREARAAPS